MNNINQEKDYCLYMHKNNVNNKVYIGITCQKPPSKRWKNGSAYKHNEYFTRAIQKYGWDNFEHIILKDGLSLDEANLEEINAINFYQSTNPSYGYNIRPGGDHSPHSEITKEKIRQKALNWSEQTKKRMSEAAKRRVLRDGVPFKGKHLSEQTKQKLREVDRSYTQTPQYRAKMSEATKGAKNGSAIKVKAISLDGKQIIHFGYKQEALDFLGLSRSSLKFLNKAINNKTSYHNYFWEEE